MPKFSNQLEIKNEAVHFIKNHNLLLTTNFLRVNIIQPSQNTGDKMEIQYNELDNGIRLIKLIGDLDIMGANAIETKFAGYCAGENARVLVDLSAVDFLASIGIRLLTTNAKSLLSRG
jgi:hypothetical protein